MSTDRPPSEPGGDSDDWELVNDNDSNASDDGQSSSSCEFVKLGESTTCLPQDKDHKHDERGFDDSGETVVAAQTEPETIEPSSDAAADASTTAHPVTATPDSVIAAPDSATVQADQMVASPDDSSAESIDVIPDEKINKKEDDLRSRRSPESPERVEEVYEELREQLSARMSRESSSESEASDFVRLRRAERSTQRGDPMRVSGSSVSSRFSFIQHVERGDEDESLPESDISLLNAEAARDGDEESVMALPPTNHPHYLHSNNTDLNFWLNVMVIVVLALAVGLGIGHAVGSSRQLASNRDAQVSQSERLDSLHGQLTSCMSRLETVSMQNAEMDKMETIRMIDSLRERIDGLENNNRELSTTLKAKTDQVRSLYYEKRNLIQQVEQLREKIGTNTFEIEKFSDKSQSQNEMLQNALNEAQSRIDSLEVKNTELQNDLKAEDLEKLKEEVSNLQSDKEVLRKQIVDLEEKSGEDLGERVREMERRNVELEKKCELVASQQDPNIREEIRKLREELEKERTISNLWTAVLSAKNASLPFMYEHFRSVLNSTRHLPDELRTTFSNLSNSTVINEFLARAMNSTQKLDQLPGLAVNTSKDVLEFLSQTYDRVSEKTKKELPNYVDKTKETVNEISKQIQETWSKLKDLTIHDSDFKKGARKIKDTVKGFGEGVAENVRKMTENFKEKFSGKFNKKERTTTKRRDHDSRKDQNNNDSGDENRNFGKRQKHEKKFSYEENTKHRKTSSDREYLRKKMNKKMAKLREQIQRLNKKSWLKMDQDDVEDIFEDLAELLKFFTTNGFDFNPWLECQKTWFQSQYLGDTVVSEDCKDQLFAWQGHVYDSGHQGDKRNSTSEWYFKRKDRDQEPDWYFKRAESREDSHHDPDWQFRRARQREDDRKTTKRQNHQRKRRFHDSHFEECHSGRSGDEFDWDCY